MIEEESIEPESAVKYPEEYIGLAENYIDKLEQYISQERFSKINQEFNSFKEPEWIEDWEECFD